ncbi:hypothetical protein C8035_v009776 [Colletotrichum spinosum]|uniref:Uncharacterized protein n=1 Tax=Colletotrichum spinosum TaxID=1347390 RepID=A0A4R8Q9T8_9PEZI|nr:hypothetical protein C8035_v009776 [Colletotrichum spinosum]
METQRVNDELLKLILTKLHRLETRFNEVDTRLISMEFSMLPAGAGSRSPDGPLSSSPPASRRCSCHIPQPVFQSFDLDWDRHVTPSAYKASVDKLRNRFEFDDQSEFSPQDIGVASTCDGRSEVVDANSVSVYPSRPVSNFGFRANDVRPPLPDLPSMRYEDMPTSDESLWSRGVSSRRASMGSRRRTFSAQQSSFSTARTSIALSSTPETPPSPASFSKLRGSIKRATSLSIPRRRSSSTRDAGLAVEKRDNARLAAERIRTAALQQQELERFVQLAQKSAKACFYFIPRVMASISRSMMNQQLKMLDVAT